MSPQSKAGTRRARAKPAKSEKTASPMEAMLYDQAVRLAKVEMGVLLLRSQQEEALLRLRELALTAAVAQPAHVPWYRRLFGLGAR